jgi:hypothetical protein
MTYTVIPMGNNIFVADTPGAVQLLISLMSLAEFFKARKDISNHGRAWLPVLVEQLWARWTSACGMDGR